MSKYTTVAGDMWDSIAYRLLGSESYVPQLMSENPAYLGYAVFPEGVELVIPDVDTTAQDALPPWKQVAG